MQKLDNSLKTTWLWSHKNNNIFDKLKMRIVFLFVLVEARMY